MRHGLSVYNNVGVGWIVEVSDPDSGATVTMRFDEFAAVCGEVVEAIGSTAYYRIQNETDAATSRRQIRGAD